MGDKQINKRIEEGKEEKTISIIEIETTTKKKNVNLNL